MERPIAIPCCIYVEFLLTHLETTLREARRKLRGECTQSDEETMTRDGVLVCNFRRIMSHNLIVQSEVQALCYMLCLLEQCKITRNNGLCDSTVCNYCVYHREIRINPEHFPNVVRVYEFWMGNCRHSLRYNYYPQNL